MARIVLEFCYVVLAVDHNGDDLPELHVLSALRVEELGDVTFLLHLEIDCGFVSFNLSEDIAWFDLIALFLQPLGDVTL